MDLHALADLGQLIGGVAVVVSLVYLAVQVRQNTLSQRTENYARALERLAAMQSLLSQDDALSHIFATGVAKPADLKPQERIRFTWAVYEAFGAFEFMFHAARSRAIPPEVWERWSAAVAWWLSFPGIRKWWNARPVPFTLSFTEFVEALVRDNPTDPDAVARWRDFVSGGD